MKAYPKHLSVTSIITLAVMLLIISGSFLLNTPPAVIQPDQAEDNFSAIRAAEHLHFIASEKNPVGSEANTMVRQYIIDHLERMELKPELHQTRYYNPSMQRAASLGNVLARIKGSGDGDAIMFMGHFDTVEDAYGAADNGSAVATMLEVIRLMQDHPPVKNDLIFFFPDGEEIGLLGARAFLEEHPWVKDIRVVINLDAMGSSGQSIMFETGNNNLGIIRAMAESVPYPIASSLSTEVYRRMPNDTDFSPFRDRGFQGLNIAFIGNTFDYHTGGDNIENLDKRSLQHHGSYALALAKHLGNINLNDIRARQDAVYFNTLGYGFVYYPVMQAGRYTMLVSLLFVLVLVLGIINKQIDLPGTLKGVLGFAIFLGFLYLIIQSLYDWLSSFYSGGGIRLLHYQFKPLMLGFAAITAFFSLAFFRMATGGFNKWQIGGMAVALLLLGIAGNQLEVFMAAAIVVSSLLLFLFFRKQNSIWNLTMGALALWIALMILSTFIAPGASYLFTWPSMVMLFVLGVFFIFPAIRNHQMITCVLLLLASIPALIWFPTLSATFATAMGLEYAGISMLVIGLMVGLILPLIGVIHRQRTWTIHVAALVAGIFFLWQGGANLDDDERYRRANNIMYGTDGETGQSHWFTLDHEADSWTSHFLTNTPDTIPLRLFYPYVASTRPGKIADGPNLAPPVARLLSEDTQDGQRTLNLHILPGREHVGSISLFLESDSQTLSVKFDRNPKHLLRPFGQTSWYQMTYYAPPADGFLLTIFSEADAWTGLHLTGHSYGLPNFAAAPPRPSHMMARRDQSIASIYYLFD